jgi:hypothetical protein
MGTGQMMVTMGAMILLSIIILSINNGYLINNEVMLNAKFDLLAVSLAISVLEDANGLAFDAKTIGGNTVTDVSLLSSIGPGASEYYISRDSNNFNDFDDYNDLHIEYDDSTLRSAIYVIDCKVGYISDSNPDVFVGYKTWLKKLDIKLYRKPDINESSELIRDTIKMSTVMSYFYFR